MSYETLAEATNQFDPDRRIGLGRFGPIYMGELPDGTEVAVRRLSLNSRQGKREFAKGVKNIIELQHRNVVKLIGCCYSNSRLLVYEYIGNGSVASALFEGKINLEWSTRYKILLETAQGLSYLHEESQRILAHGDIKASNILLDRTMRPKIADFGLANLFYYDAGEVKFQDMASVGYMAPELALHGQLSGKADVFSFGVLALEVVSGRTNTDINLIGTNMQHLLAWVWKLQEREQVIKILDPRIKGNYMEEEVKKVINIAILCTQDAPKLRPTMARVVSMLKGESPLPNMPSKPGAMQALGLGEQNMSGTFSIRIPSERKSRRWGLSSSTASGISHSGRMQYSVVIPR
jgi:serine/threonine protein kinase